MPEYLKFTYKFVWYEYLDKNNDISSIFGVLSIVQLI